MRHWVLRRQDNLEKLALHGQFVWADEFDWQSLAQSEGVRSLSGAMIIQQGTRTGGRPITLDGSRAWILRGDLQRLRLWADEAELVMQLDSPDGRQFMVMFARPAMSDAQAITPYRAEDETDGDWWRVKVHLMTV